MGTAYYYFAASLPMLEFGTKAPVSLENFLEDCKRLLSPGDFADIMTAVSDEKEEGAGRERILKIWKQFYHNFHNEIAWFRANQAGKDPLDHIHGERIVEPAVAACLEQAAKSPDPLTGERMLDSFLWQQLDELAQGHYFDIGFLIVYAAKLKILQRYQMIESSKGKEIFEEYKAQVFY